MVNADLTPKELEIIIDLLSKLSTLNLVEATLWEKIDFAIPMEHEEEDE